MNDDKNNSASGSLWSNVALERRCFKSIGQLSIAPSPHFLTSNHWRNLSSPSSPELSSWSGRSEAVRDSTTRPTMTWSAYSRSPFPPRRTYQCLQPQPVCGTAAEDRGAGSWEMFFTKHLRHRTACQ